VPSRRKGSERKPSLNKKKDSAKRGAEWLEMETESKKKNDGNGGKTVFNDRNETEHRKPRKTIAW